VAGAIDTRGFPFHIDWSPAAVLRLEGGALATVLAFGELDPYWLQVEHFAASVAAGRDPLIDGREGWRDLAVCRAVYEADRRRAAVQPEPCPL